MPLSKEILDKINAVKEEMQNLLKDGKVKEAHDKLEEFNNLKDEYQVQLALEAEDKAKFDHEKIVNGLSNEKVEFLNSLRAGKFTNAFSEGDNGAIIPETIAKDIIDTVKEKMDIVADSTKFSVKGTVAFPKYSNDSSKPIVAAYGEDFVEATEGTGKFTTVKLDSYLVTSLAKIGKNLIAKTDVAVYNFVINKIADTIADFLQKEMTVGTVAAGKITGYEVTNNTVEMEGERVTADDLINMQMSIVTPFQKNAKWRMTKAQLKGLRKLKDSDGRYLLNPDLRSGFGYELLGKPVEVNEEATAICYGDFSGYYVNFLKNVQIQVLTEKYATQNAIGILANCMVDGKPIDTQKYVKLVAKA